jgi:hypothetical protein
MGCRVRLRPQPARALEHLLERHGKFVSRGELQRVIWPDGTFVHFDHGLNSCMKQIRAALGDSRSAPAYVETLVKRGFRFIAPVTVVFPQEHAAGPRGTRIRVLPVRSLGDSETGDVTGAEGLSDEILVQLTGASPPVVAVVSTALLGSGANLEPEVPVVWIAQFDTVVDRPFDAQLSVAKSIVREVVAMLGRDPGRRASSRGGDRYDVGGRHGRATRLPATQHS